MSISEQSGIQPCAPKTVLVTNLDQPSRATTIVPSDAGWAAQSFVTDDSDYWLESIEIISGNLVGKLIVIYFSGLIPSLFEFQARFYAT